MRDAREQGSAPSIATPSSPLDDFCRSFTLIALDVVDVRPYYLNSVLWTLEMDYITTIVEDGKVKIIANQEGANTTPSWVAFKDNEHLVG